jgi:hypothetical protein
VYFIVAEVHNAGIGTAENARAYFYHSEEEKAGTRVCWAIPEFGSSEISTDERVEADPDAIADFLRRKVLTNTSENVQGGDVLPVIVAFIVKGSKSVFIPTTYRSTFPLPHAFEKVAVSISMNDNAGSEVPLKDFAVFEFGKMGLKQAEEKSGS